MALLFYSATDRDGRFESSFREELKNLAPDLEIRNWPDIGDASDIQYAALWLPPQGLFASLTHLTHIFALSAGVDKLLSAEDLPKVPIYRLQDGGMATPMSEYVLYGVLKAQRQINVLKDAQSESLWKRDAIEPAASDWKVGILGAGVLAEAVAKRLLANGYSVRTWSRSRKNVTDIQSFAGNEELDAFRENLNTLVCLLPLTDDTQDLLNASFFEKLPMGTNLINAARGEHCVDADLIAALDSGQLSHALLDVFREEPLPRNHPFWHHPNIQITPHIAAPTSGNVAAKQVAQKVADAIAGKEPEGFVDRTHGY